MKFGLESEKFLFNLETRLPSESVFSFIDGLSDFRGFENSTQITNEFVLNMVEIGTTPSARALDVIKDYLLHYLMIRKVALRENVVLVPMASLPMDYLPHMTTKWSYYVQNSILSGKRPQSWMMKKDSPIRNAGNCAGVHVHAEIETAPEFLFSNRELVNKFNMGLMMTPMIAFSSSPYFFGKHRASSMRGLAYYFETYRNFPINGQLPPVMETSADVLNFFRRGIDNWLKLGTNLGFKAEELQSLTSMKGANWNPVRWNRRWNTIEIRCLDSDSIELDCAKFVWVTGAMKRMDPRGEALECRPISSERELDLEMVRDCFTVKGKEVTVLPSHAISALFERAVIFGIRDDIVYTYLERLAEFSAAALDPEVRDIFRILEKVLHSGKTTSESLLRISGHAEFIDDTEAASLVISSVKKQETLIKTLRPQAADIFSQIEEMYPHGFEREV